MRAQDIISLSYLFLIFILGTPISYADLNDWFEENKDEEFELEVIGESTTKESATGSGSILVLLIIVIMVLALTKKIPKPKTTKNTSDIEDSEFIIKVKKNGKIIEEHTFDNKKEAILTKKTLENTYADQKEFSIEFSNPTSK